MELYQLKIFYTLSKLKSFTQTGKTLCISQPAVSSAIKKLERSVEIKLIKTKGKNFELTSAGEKLFLSCGIIFKEMENASENLKKIHQKAKWKINIGSTVEFGNTVLASQISQFTSANPQIHLNFLFSHSLIRPLLSEEVDLIIDCREHHIPGIRSFDLFQEEYITIVSPEFYQKNPIKSPLDLNEIPVLTIDRELKWWKNFFSTLLASEIPVLTNIIQINHIRGLINAVIHHMGVGFVPRYTVHKELKENLLLNPFPNLHPKADFFRIYLSEEKLEQEKIQLLLKFLSTLELPQ